MVKNIVLLIFFLLSMLLGKDLYIFDDFQKDEDFLSKHYKKPKDGDFIVLDKKEKTKLVQKHIASFSKIKRKTISKKIKPAKEINISIDNTKKTVSSTNNKQTKQNSFDNKSITQLLKLYKKQVDANTPSKSLFSAIRNKLLKEDSNIYDKIALLNALEDIQNKNINKYEASLTLKTMIKEIK